jgi:hypothetical protein
VHAHSCKVLVCLLARAHPISRLCAHARYKHTKYA